MRTVKIEPRKRSVKIEVVHIATHTSFVSAYQTVKVGAERA